MQRFNQEAVGAMKAGWTNLSMHALKFMLKPKDDDPSGEPETSDKARMPRTSLKVNQQRRPSVASMGSVAIEDTEPDQVVVESRATQSEWTELIAQALKADPGVWRPVSQMVKDSFWLEQKYGLAFSSRLSRLLNRSTDRNKGVTFKVWKKAVCTRRKQRIMMKFYKARYPDAFGGLKHYYFGSWKSGTEDAKGLKQKTKLIMGMIVRMLGTLLQTAFNGWRNCVQSDAAKRKRLHLSQLKISSEGAEKRAERAEQSLVMAEQRADRAEEKAKLCRAMLQALDQGWFGKVKALSEKLTRLEGGLVLNPDGVLGSCSEEGLAPWVAAMYCQGGSGGGLEPEESSLSYSTLDFSKSNWAVVAVGSKHEILIKRFREQVGRRLAGKILRLWSASTGRKRYLRWAVSIRTARRNRRSLQKWTRGWRVWAERSRRKAARLLFSARFRGVTQMVVQFYEPFGAH
jgi:hypothetical protein